MKGLKHPATIIAAVALFAALGGGAAWASGLISGSQIKNHSIAEKKLTKKAVKALHGQRGARGPAGAAGATGATGAAGPQGPPGPDNERLAAQRDAGGGGLTVDLSTSPTINTVTFTAPSAGFITVSGQAFVNDEGFSGDYELIPKLDGTAIAPQPWAALQASPGGESFTLNFTISVAVAAGAHTVTDTLAGEGSGSGNDEFYNANNLSVLFVPTGTVATAITAHGASNLNSVGG
jgi:hypothetical protein